MAAKTTINFIKLGVFVTVGVLILVISLYFIGSKKNMFGDTFTLYAIFNDVNGLKKGNNVRYGGIEIGIVENISVINDTSIRVEMKLESDMKHVIRKNSTAAVGTDGLMGDKLININAGNVTSAVVEDGGQIYSMPIIDT